MKISCTRCGGSGKTEHSHVAHGICFLCGGLGQVSELKVAESNEYKIAKKQKIQAILKEQEGINIAKWNMVYIEQEAKNIEFVKNYPSIPRNKGEENLLNKLQSLSNIILNQNSTEKEVREFINDYFYGASFDFRFFISKWTFDNYNFIFVDTDGKYNIKNNIQTSNN